MDIGRNVAKKLRDSGYKQSKTKNHIWWKDEQGLRVIIDLRKKKVYAYDEEGGISDAPNYAHRDFGMIKAELDKKQTKLF